MTSHDATDVPDAPKPDAGTGRRFRVTPERRARIIEGLVLGTLIGLGAARLGINNLSHDVIAQDAIILPAIGCGLLAAFGARSVVRILAVLMVIALLIVGYTPITAALMPAVIQNDRPAPVDAIVVLSTQVHQNGALDSAAQERLVRAYTLLRQGFSDRLVVTRSNPNIGDQGPATLEQMRMLGLNYPVESAGPVGNTHDEAVTVGLLAHQKGWRRLIVVTHPWHTRRARALFLKAGVDVLMCPCEEGSYDLGDLSLPGGRYHAFRDWLHETVGIIGYRLRGWL